MAQLELLHHCAPCSTSGRRPRPSWFSPSTFLKNKKESSAAKLKWHITGEIADSQIGSLLELGVETKNKRAVQEANKNLQRLDVKLRNLTEFFSDTTFNVPDDINNLDNT